MKIYTSFQRNVFVLIGICIAVFIGMCIWHVKWIPIRHALLEIHNLFFVFFAIALYVAGHFLRGLRTRWLVSPDAKLSVLTASNIVIAGYAVNNIIPARVGEPARAGMLSERTGLPFMQSLTVVFVERILDGLAIVVLLCCAAPVVGLFDNYKESIVFICLLLFIGAGGVLLFVVAPNRVFGRISKSLSAIGPHFHDRVIQFVTSISNGVSYLRDPANTLRVFLLSIAVWLCDTGLFLLLLPAFGLQMNIFFALCVMGIANLSIFFIPVTPGYSSPGNIGPFQLVCIQTLVFLGITRSTAIQYAVIAQFVIFLLIMIWGGAVFLWYGWTLRRARSLSHKATDVSSSPEQVCAEVNRIGSLSPVKETRSPSAFIISLTEAAVPLNDEQLNCKQEAVYRTAQFIHQEIHNLPRKFYILMMIGLSGFRLLVSVRYFKDFVKLPLNLRKRAFGAFAYGKVGPARKLFKLVRSTALLGFYEYSKNEEPHGSSNSGGRHE